MCNELAEGRLAIISVGTSPVFNQIKLITNFFKIPYLAVKWENEKLSELPMSELSAAEEHADEPKATNEFPTYANMHPPANYLINAITDLIIEYNWEYVTILYSESTGPDKIQELIKLPFTNMIPNRKFRLQVKQLSKDISKWVYLIKDVTLSGSSSVIVDIDMEHFAEFVKIVKHGLDTHILFELELIENNFE